MSSDKLPYNVLSFEWDIDRVNSFLIEEYGYDLFDFAYSIAIVFSKNLPIRFWNIWSIRNPQIPYIKICKEEIKTLEGIKPKFKKIIWELDDHLEQLKYWDVRKGRIAGTFFPPFFPSTRIKGKLDRENIVKSNYKLKNVLKTIEKEINYYNDYLRLDSASSGRPSMPKTIISSLWSLIMKDSKRIHLENINSLLYWFYMKLESTSYGKNLVNLLGLQEISRFRSKYEDFLEKDRKEIFSHNYIESSPNIKKPKAFQIRFEKEEPKFYDITFAQEDERQPLIVFPDDSKFY